MSKRTAVAAPPAEPFDELFAVIDAMTLEELMVFTSRLLTLKWALFGDGIDRDLPPLAGIDARSLE